VSEEHIFRAYDVRGIFNVEVTPETAAKIGMAFGTFLGEGKKVLVGRDGRTSSPIFEAAFLAGLTAAGCNAHTTGLVPIPTANFRVWKGGYDAGAYITASHNPPEYNGVRFRHPDGSGYTHQNQEIRDLFLEGRYCLAPWNRLGEIAEIDPEETLKEYGEFLKERFDLQRELKVVLDTGNGASSLTAPPLFRGLGCTVSTLNARIDGTFPGRPSEPSEETLGDLRKAVPAEGGDFGAGYDGDGDRVVFVDDRGRTVQTEKIGILIARELLKVRKGTIIANVSCSMILEEEIQKLGGRVERVRVGDVFVCEAIKEHGALFALETSAHYFLPSFYIFDDPLLISLKLAEILSRTSTPLSQLLDEIPSYPMATENLPCPDEIKFQVMDRIVESCRAKGYRLDQTDGAKILFEDGWALLRPSNTTPLIRTSVEAKDPERLEELRRLVREEFEAALRETSR
jgi:phosphomannomutase/phosphoglucomutase